MKNLRKTLASVAIMAALVAGCQTNSPTPEVVVVKKPDPITPADTTKKDTTKVVVVPPTPVSPKVIAGQKCYEARVIARLPYTAVVVQVLNDSIGVKGKINVAIPNSNGGYTVGYKEFSNIITLTIPSWNLQGNETFINVSNIHSTWEKSGKVYFTIDKIEENIPNGWGLLIGLRGNNIVPFDIASRGIIVSSYSTQSCKP